MMNERISEKLTYPSHFAEVYGSKMHYIEAGHGDPILLLHGIPTSCYIWRNIIPHLSSLGRCIAPDLIGFGRSDKPNISYSIEDHIKYINQFIETLNLKKITLIMHGWGSIIGFNYAIHHEKNCKGVVFYEAFLGPMDNEEVALPFQEQLFTLEELEHISKGVMDSALLVDKIISQSIMRKLTPEEMNHYRQPFLQKGTEKPILQYLKELSQGNGKGKIEQLILEYSKKLKNSQLPKLMLYSLPGFVTTIATVMWAKENLPNLEIAEVGEELHLGQESNPQQIGETISIWLQGVEQS